MRRAPALALSAAAIAAAVLSLAVVDGWWGGAGAAGAPRAPISVETSLSPRAVQFGDSLEGHAVVILDPSRVEPASVRLVPRFASYRVAHADRQTRQIGGTTRVTYRFELECLVVGCAPGRPQVVLQFPEATLRFRLHDGAARHVAVTWPAVTVASRLDDADRADPLGHLRADTSPPPVSYDVPPDALVDGLVAAAAALALAVGSLLALAFRRAAAPRSDRTGRTSLQEILQLVRETTTNGAGPGHRRMALQRLVRELRGSGREELADTAGRIAWSNPDPSAERAREVADRVESEVAEQ